MGYGVEGELVAVETHAGDGAGGHRADYGTLAELVAGGRVGNMDFHKRQVLVNDHVRGVGESIRIVREGGGVHDHRGFLVGGLVHPVHHFGFVVGLTHLDFEAEVLAPFGAELAQGVEVLTTVDVGLADAETSEVRAIDNDVLWSLGLLLFVLLSLRPFGAPPSSEGGISERNVDDQRTD